MQHECTLAHLAMLISLTILGLGSVTVCELLSTIKGKLLSTFNKKKAPEGQDLVRSRRLPRVRRNRRVPDRLPGHNRPVLAMLGAQSSQNKVNRRS